MTLPAIMRALDEVSKALPFAVDDYNTVNATFTRWREAGSDEDYEVLQKWIYCYSRRYFIVKFMRMRNLSPADIEEPIGDAFRRARLHMASVDKPERFASYVSVICKNVFVTFCRKSSRRKRVDVEIELAPDLEATTHDPFADSDRSVLIYAVRTAIARLPDWLQEVATMRLVEGRSYEEIEAVTTYQKATLRAYTSKALVKLREDPLLVDFLDEWRL